MTCESKIDGERIRNVDDVPEMTRKSSFYNLILSLSLFYHLDFANLNKRPFSTSPSVLNNHATTW